MARSWSNRLKLTLCANRSCCRLRPVRNLEKDVGTAEARGSEESARCMFIWSIKRQDEKISTRERRLGNLRKWKDWKAGQM